MNFDTNKTIEGMIRKTIERDSTPSYFFGYCFFTLGALILINDAHYNTEENSVYAIVFVLLAFIWIQRTAFLRIIKNDYEKK